MPPIQFSVVRIVCSQQCDRYAIILSHRTGVGGSRSEETVRLQLGSTAGAEELKREMSGEMSLGWEERKYK